ncbi:MAG TPA: hypothetical protein PK601_02790 [Methanothermobacter sp.]|nr:hypothetical protein [Methanothermobacter sp.]
MGPKRRVRKIITLKLSELGDNLEKSLHPLVEKFLVGDKACFPEYIRSKLSIEKFRVDVFWIF